MIISISEGKDNEFGIGILENNNVSLYQISTSVYKLVLLINQYQPNSIILCNSRLQPLLNNTIVSRSKFNYEIGHQILKNSILFEYAYNGDDDESSSRIISTDKELIAGKYYAICALSALNSADNIIYYTMEMHLDNETMRQLNLKSIISKLDETKTPMGKRTFKSAILQPSIHYDDINSRQSSIQELIQKSEILQDIRQALSDFGDLDNIISTMIHLPKQGTPKFSEQSINRMILLRSMLNKVILLSKITSSLQTKLLKEINHATMHVDIKSVLANISEVLDDEITFQNTATGLRNQKGFAVRAGHNNLLDVARKTFKEGVEDCSDIVAQYCTTYELPITLAYSSGFGYYMTAPPTTILPKEFINSKKTKKHLEFTSISLMSQNDRISQSLNEIYMLSEEAISILIFSVIDFLPLLYLLSDCVATLDLLASQAQNAIIRPIFSNQLKITNYYPLHPLNSNPISITLNSQLTFVTGPNSSGKSTLSVEIVLATVLAHCGFFLNATEAEIPKVNAILVVASSIPYPNLSSFSEEMRVLASLPLFPGAMIVFDDLMCGTSVTDSTAITIALIQELLSKSVTGIIITHFPDVIEWGMAIGAKVYQMVMDQSHNKLSPTFNVTEGKSPLCYYGIALALEVGVPEDVIAVAKNISLGLSNPSSLDGETEPNSDKNKSFHRSQLALLKNLSFKEQVLNEVHSILIGKFSGECIENILAVKRMEVAEIIQSFHSNGKSSESVSSETF